MDKHPLIQETDFLKGLVIYPKRLDSTVEPGLLKKSKFATFLKISGLSQALFVSRRSSRKPVQPKSQFPKLATLEILEDRSVPASLYVDLPGAFTITKDTAPTGFSNGDTVTWNGETTVNSLIVGKDAFGSVQSAITAASASDKVFLASDTYTDGLVKILKDSLTIDVPAKTAGVSFELGNNVATANITLTGAGAVNVFGNQVNNKIVGNAGNNTLNATFNVEDLLKADPTTPVSIPTASGTNGVTAMSGRLLSNANGNFFVFRVRNGSGSNLTTTGKVFGGATFATNITLPALTDTFFAAPTNSSYASITAVFTGGVAGTKASNGTVTPFTYSAGGDDSLTGGDGDDTLTGGDGTDTANFSGKYADYTISVSGGIATVKDISKNKNEGTDTLTTIEKLAFSDKTVRPAPTSLGFSAGTTNAGVSTKLVFGSLLGSLSATSGKTSVSVTLSLDGKTTDGVFTATNPGTLTSFGVSDSNISLTGSPTAINNFLNSGNIQYKSFTNAGRLVSFNFGDGLNINGSTNLNPMSAVPVFSSANNTTITYGQSLNFTVVASNSPTYSITTGSLPAGVKLDSSTGVLSGIAGAGTYNFTITATANSQTATQDFTLKVNQASLTVTAAAKTKVYGSGDPTLTYSSSGLVNGDTAAVFTGAISRAAGETVGTYAINQNTLSAGANYSVSFVGANLSITKATLVVTATGNSKTYDGKTNATVVFTDNRKAGDSLTLSATAINFSTSTAGVGKTINATGLSISGSDADNYSLSVTTVTTTAEIKKADLTITADNKGKPVNAPNPVLTSTFSGLVPGETSSVVSGLKISTTAVLKSPAGVYPINLSGGAASNYTIKLVNGTLKVGSAPLITSANKTSFTYGTKGTFQVITTGASGITLAITKGALPNGVTFDTKTGIISGTPLPGTIGVFTFTITASNGVPNNANQVFNLTVNKANLVIKATNATKIYGTTRTFSGTEFTTTGLVPSDSISSVTLTSFGATGKTPVGNYSIVASAAKGTNLANYSITYSNGSLAVTKAALTIQANNVSKTYGNLLSLNMTLYTTTGLVNGDKISGLKLSSLGTPTTAAAGNYNIVPASATGGSLGNYSITYVNGTLTVNKALLTITPNSRQKDMGSTVFFQGTEFVATGLKNSDSIQVLNLESKGSPAEVDIGAYPIVASAATGKGLGNYEIKYLEGNLQVVKPEDYSSILGKGTFTTEAEGKISVDFLFDGGGFVGQMGFYSLAGMTSFKPGSDEFIKEAVRRVLTNSGEGRIIISDITEAARSSAKLLTDNLFNNGKYLGVKGFQMDGNSQFGVILIPNATFTEVRSNPSVGGFKRALFSHNLANPSNKINNGAQLSDLTGESTVFAWEDTRLDDATCDRDYNDIIFRILGAKGEAPDYVSLAAPLENITKDPAYKGIIA